MEIIGLDHNILHAGRRGSREITVMSSWMPKRWNELCTDTEKLLNSFFKVLGLPREHSPKDLPGINSA